MMPPAEHHIFVNKRRHETKAESLTGAEILALAGLSPTEYDLHLVKGEGKSQQILPETQVHIENGLHFNAITRGVNFG